MLQFIIIFTASCSDGTCLVVEIHSEERVIPLISDIKPGCFTFFSGSMDIAVFNFEVDSLVIATIKVCRYKEQTCIDDNNIIVCEQSYINNNILCYYYKAPCIGIIILLL